MEPKGKRRKIQEKKHDLEIDRLGSLPDSILTHIFSFLDTRAAVMASFLSKRYEPLWTMLPSLDFRLYDSHRHSSKPYVDKLHNPIKNCSVASFERYVNIVLQQREPSNLNTFRMSVHRLVGLEFMQNCVDYAAHHKVQHLRIRCYCKQTPIILPEMLIKSSSLITLHLNNATKYNIELPRSVQLPNLKILRLKRFEFSNENFSGELFSGCPSLETLVLSKSRIRPGDRLKALDVNCLNLRNLEIKCWRSPWRCFHEHLINVNAPNLAFFKLQGQIVRMNFKEALPCLDKVCVDLCNPSGCTAMVDVYLRKLETSETFLKMLLQLCSVKSLSVTVEVLSKFCYLQVCAPFNFENLRFIKITAEDKSIEKTIPIETVVGLLKKAFNDVVMFHVYKEPKLTRKYSKKHNNATTITLPSNVMRFLLDSSPAAEFLSIEIPEVSLDQE